MLEFEASIDPLSLAALGRFEQMDLLPGAVQAGIGDAGQILINRIRQYASDRFKNPTGRLGNSFQVVQNSRFDITVGSDVPYAHRRDVSFKGPDALGRLYPNDPASYYATDALQDSEQEIGERLAATIDAALGRLGGGY